MIGSRSMKYESEHIFHYTAHKKFWSAIAENVSDKYEILSNGKYYGLTDEEILTLVHSEHACLACGYADAVLEEKEEQEPTLLTCDLCPLIIEDKKPLYCLGGLYHNFCIAKDILDSMHMHLVYCDYHKFETEQDMLRYYKTTIDIYKNELKTNLPEFELNEKDFEKVFIEEINKIKKQDISDEYHDSILIRCIGLVINEYIIFPLTEYIGNIALEIANLPVREGVRYD